MQTPKDKLLVALYEEREALDAVLEAIGTYDAARQQREQLSGVAEAPLPPERRRSARGACRAALHPYRRSQPGATTAF